MPQLGIEDSRAASSSGIPRAACSDGIRNAMPLIKRNELAVAPGETDVIDQRTPEPSSGVAVGSIGIFLCLHTAGKITGTTCVGARGRMPGCAALATLTGLDRDGPPRPAAPRSRP